MGWQPRVLHGISILGFGTHDGRKTKQAVWVGEEE